MVQFFLAYTPLVFPKWILLLLGRTQEVTFQSLIFLSARTQIFPKRQNLCTLGKKKLSYTPIHTQHEIIGNTLKIVSRKIITIHFNHYYYPMLLATTTKSITKKNLYIFYMNSCIKHIYTYIL